MTLWHPDTCDCQIEISDDPKTRGQAVKYVKMCDAHAKLAYAHGDVLEENQVKNKAVGVASDLHPDAQFVWSFDDVRSVVLTNVDGKVDATGKQDLLTAIDTKLQTDLAASYEPNWVKVV